MRTDLIILGNKGSNYTNPVLSATKSLLKHKCNLSIAFYTFNFLKQSKFTLLYKPWKYFEKFSKFSISAYRSKSKTMKSRNFPVSSIKRKKNQLTLKVLKQFRSFPSFRFLYKGQNRKLGKLWNFQLLPAKHEQVLKQFTSSYTKIENSETSGIFIIL